MMLVLLMLQMYPLCLRISIQTNTLLDTSGDNETRVGAARILDFSPSLEGVSTIPVHASESLFDDGYDSDGLMAVNYDLNRELNDLEEYYNIDMGLEGVGTVELATAIVEGEGGDSNGGTFALLMDVEISKFKVDTLRK